MRSAAPSSPAGRADGDQDNLRILERFREIGGEPQPAIPLVFLHHGGKPGLVDGNLPAPQRVDAGRIEVHAHDVMADLRQPCCRHQAHVTTANDRYTHCVTPAAP